MYVQVTLWISYTLGAVEIHHSYWYHGVIPSDMKYWLYVNYLWDFSKWTDAALKLSKACIRIKVPQVKTKWGNVKTLINEVLVFSIIRLFLMNCSSNLDFLGMLTLLFRKKTAVYGIGFLEWNPKPWTLCVRLRFAYSDGIFWVYTEQIFKKNHGFLCNSMSQIIILASHLLKPIDSFEFVWVQEIFINSLKRMKTSQHFSFETPSVSLSFYLRLKKAA